jgi:hypothetical protein
MVVTGAAGPAPAPVLAGAGGVLEKKFELPKTLEVLVHPVSNAAVEPNNAAMVRRRVGVAAAAPRTCNSADIAVPLTSACALA